MHIVSGFEPSFYSSVYDLPCGILSGRCSPSFLKFFPAFDGRGVMLALLWRAGGAQATPRTRTFCARACRRPRSPCVGNHFSTSSREVTISKVRASQAEAFGRHWHFWNALLALTPAAGLWYYLHHHVRGEMREISKVQVDALKLKAKADLEKEEETYEKIIEAKLIGGRKYRSDKLDEKIAQLESQVKELAAALERESKAAALERESKMEADEANLPSRKVDDSSQAPVRKHISRSSS